MIKFAVPYNGDINLIDEVLKKYEPYVESFFGNLGIDDFGGGRAQNATIISTEEMLKKITRKLNAKNIDFNYVINNTSLLNDEFKDEYINKFKKFLHKLIQLGVRKITLCNPYLIKIAKSSFPELKISASVNFKTRSVEEIKYLIDLGCDEATLHYDLIKDFKKLKEIRKETDMLLKLIPNDLYIMNCPWQKGHTRMQGSHSKNKDVKTPYFSYYRNKCVNIRNIHPEEIYMGKWIAPNDISKYVEIGYENFKLLDRLASTEWILNAMNIYIKQERTTHLEEILGTYGCECNIGSAAEELKDSDNVYPREKLESVPSINYECNEYWFSDSHKFNCGRGCNLCKKMSDEGLSFPEDIRESYLENNRQWQNKVTKLDFIEKLNKQSAKRIEYI